MKNIVKFFDKLEDKIRKWLSRKPILYAFIGSVGIILLWRGIWMLADEIQLSGALSVIIGSVILMAIGLFVSFFVGEQIIISGIKQEKRIDEKTEEEIKREEITLREIHEDMEKIKSELEEINHSKVDKNN